MVVHDIQKKQVCFQNTEGHTKGATRPYIYLIGPYNAAHTLALFMRMVLNEVDVIKAVWKSKHRNSSNLVRIKKYFFFWPPVLLRKINWLEQRTRLESSAVD